MLLCLASRYFIDKRDSHRLAVLAAGAPSCSTSPLKWRPRHASVSPRRNAPRLMMSQRNGCHAWTCHEINHRDPQAAVTYVAASAAAYGAGTKLPAASSPKAYEHSALAGAR